MCVWQPHEVALDDTRERILNELEAEFLAAGYQPRAEDLFAKLNIGKGHDKALLQVLLDQGRAVRLKENVVFHRSSLAKAESLVRSIYATIEITPIEFKDLLGISRKYAIPMLEYFDSQRSPCASGISESARGELTSLTNAPTDNTAPIVKWRCAIRRRSGRC